MVSLVRADLFEVLWKCGVDLGVRDVHREMEAKGMSVNCEGENRTMATFWSRKGRGADGGNKRC